MAKKYIKLSHFFILHFFLSFLTLNPCIVVKPISKGELTNNLNFTFSYLNYANVGKNNRGEFLKGCKIYFSFIYDSNNRIIEKIASYPCAKVAPIKFIFNYDIKGIVIENKYFVATVENDYTIPITEVEMKLFKLLNTNKLRKDYEDYEDYTKIKGFKAAAIQDPIETLPFFGYFGKLRK